MRGMTNPSSHDAPETCALHRLTEAQALSLQIIDRLMSATDELDAAIDAALADLGRFCGSDRSYIFLQTAPGVISNTHEWCAPGITPMISTLQGLPADLITPWRASFNRDGHVYIPDVRELAMTDPLRDILDHQGIRSLLAVPLREDGALVGFMGYDAVDQVRHFLEGEIYLIRSVANIIATQLTRFRIEAEIRAARSQNDLERRRLQATFNALPDILLELDPDGRFIAAHSGRSDRFALPPDAFLGRTPEEVLPPDIARIARSAMAQAARHGWVDGMRYQLNLKDNTAAWFELSAAQRPPIQPGDGPGFVFVIRDITERVASEDALRESEALYAALVDLSPIGIALNDMKSGAFMDINPALLATTGYSRDEYLALKYRGFPAETFAETEARALADLREKGRYGPFESELLRKDGSRCPIRLRGVRAAGRDGRALVWSLVEDISAEVAQRKALEQLGDVAQQTKNLVVICDRAGQIEWVNPAFEARTGWRLDEVRGKTPGSFLQSDNTNPGTTARIGRALRNLEPVEADILNQSRSGEDYWLRLEIQPRHDAQGRHIGFIAVETDITEYKRQQDILEAIAEFSRRLLKSDDLAQERDHLLEKVAQAAQVSRAYAFKIDPPVPLGNVDADWIVSQQFEWRAEQADIIIDSPELQGLRLHSLGFRRWAEHFARGEALVLDRMDEMTAEELTTLQPLNIRALCAFPIVTDGRVSGFFGFDIRDDASVPFFEGWSRLVVSALSAAANVYASALERASGEATLTAAIDALNDGFVYFDREDRLVLANRRFREIYATSAPAMHEGARFEDILRYGLAHGQFADAQGREEAWLQERLAAHRAQDSIQQTLADGTVLQIVERMTADGGRVGLRVDITDLISARTAAEAASRAKSEFLANMSHEIRTPLNGVLGMADILSETTLDDTQRTMLSTIRDSGWSLLALLNDILDLARIESGKLGLEQSPFDLQALLNRIEALHGENARAKGIEFTIRTIPGGCHHRIGDETRVMQILHNLLGNAVKFTEQGTVCLEIDATDPQMLRFAVTDTGIGMSCDQVNRVFNAFEQAEAGTTRRFGGSGLGMAIVRKLLDLMDGDIRIKSAVGQGTRLDVHLVLPSSDTLAQIDLSDRDAPAPDCPDLDRIKGKRVLVADDNVTNRKIMAVMLDRLGVQAEFAEDGMEACNLWRSKQFDVMLLDISMPVMDGIEALRVMRAEAKSTGRALPVAVAATANVMTDQVVQYLQEGFAATLPKPVRRQHLEDVLLSALGADSPPD